MKNRTRMKWILPALCLALATPGVADDLEFHGYIRSGMAVNQDLQNAKNDNASGLGIASTLIGRLGNEDDTWVEGELVKMITAEDGAWAKMHINLTAAGSDMGLTSPSTGSANVAAYLSQAYVELGGFAFDPEAVFFVGKKANREDIHIMDLKWRNLDGAGFGVAGALGGNLEVNLLTSNNTVASTLGAVPLTLDVRYKLLPNLQVEGGAAWAKDGTKVTTSSTTAESGYQGALVYYWDRFYGLPGWMTLAVQAGTGMFGASLAKSNGDWEAWNSLGKLGNIWTQQNSVAARLVTSGQGSFGPIDVAAGAWAEYNATSQKNWNTAAGTNVAADPLILLAAAVRPAWKLTSNLSLTGELGVSDQIGGSNWWDPVTSTNHQRTGLSYKATVAPTLALDSGVGARPQLRLFATYVGQEAKLGKISTDGKQSQEVKFGVQAEVWW